MLKLIDKKIFTLLCSIFFVYLAQCAVSYLFQDKVVIGHAVHNDFQVLRIPHSRLHIRDTSFCQLLRKKFDPAAVDQKLSLKRLALQLLGIGSKSNKKIFEHLSLKQDSHKLWKSWKTWDSLKKVPCMEKSKNLKKTE